MSDQIVAHSHSVDHGLLLCLYDTHLKKKNFKTPYLGDYYSYSDVIVHIGPSHTARNGLTR